MNIPTLESASSTALANFMRIHSAFAGWSDQTIELLCQFATRIQRPAGATIHLAGTPVEHVCVLTLGVVETWTVISSGEQHVSTYLHPGLVMGLPAVFLPEPAARQQTWVAHSEVVYWRIPVAEFKSCFWADRAMAESLLRLFSQHIDWLTQTAAKMALLPAQCKVLSCLLDFEPPIDERHGRPKHPLTLTQSKLAAILGLTRQSVGTVIRDLEARGLVRVSSTNIQVVSGERLQAYAMECGAARLSTTKQAVTCESVAR